MIEKLLIILQTTIIIGLLIGIAIYFYRQNSKKKSCYQEALNYMESFRKTYRESTRNIDHIPLPWIIENEAVWDFETGAIIPCDNLLYTLGEDKQRCMISVFHPSSKSDGFTVKRTIYLKKSDKE
jgi:hypothetical protein